MMKFEGDLSLKSCAILHFPAEVCTCPLQGASPAELKRIEDSLGMRLPWELWELYRFRAGQQATGPRVAFVDDARLLRES